MSEAEFSFFLTNDEESILADLISGVPSLGKMLRNRRVEGGTELILNTSEINALQDELTEFLARVGFDAEYSLTREGGIIEDFIDKLATGGTQIRVDAR